MPSTIPNSPSLDDLLDKTEAVCREAGWPLPPGWSSFRETVAYSPSWNAEIRHLWIRAEELLADHFGNPHRPGVGETVVKLHKLWAEAFGSKCKMCAGQLNE